MEYSLQEGLHYVFSFSFPIHHFPLRRLITLPSTKRWNYSLCIVHSGILTTRRSPLHFWFFFSNSSFSFKKVDYTSSNQKGWGYSPFGRNPSLWACVTIELEEQMVMEVEDEVRIEVEEETLIEVSRPWPSRAIRLLKAEWDETNN